MKQLAPYEMVEIFHQIFDSRKPALPTALSIEEVTNRARFKVEEIIEMLAATSQNQEEFLNTLEKLHQSIDEAQEKVLKKQPTTQDILVNQVDALADLLYFTYGSFVLLGVAHSQFWKLSIKRIWGNYFQMGNHIMILRREKC